MNYNPYNWTFRPKPPPMIKPIPYHTKRKINWNSFFDMPTVFKSTPTFTDIPPPIPPKDEQIIIARPERELPKDW